MDSSAIEQKMKWLEQLLKATIARQNAQDEILEYIHDRMLFSPPVDHTDLLEDRIYDEMDGLSSRVEASNQTQARLHQALAELGDDVHRMTKGWMDAEYSLPRYLQWLDNSPAPVHPPSQPPVTDEGAYRWSR